MCIGAALGLPTAAGTGFLGLSAATAFNVGLGLNSGSGRLLFSIFCYDYNYKLNNFLMYF